MNKENPRLKSTILDIVNKQLQSGDPPEARQTFNRLIEEGISEENAKKYIGQAVIEEIFNVMKYREPFNLKRYRKNLAGLPKEPRS